MTHEPSKQATPSKLAVQLMEYLDCPCQVFEPMADDDPIQEAYWAARREGETAGFYPVALPADATLLECLMMNVGQRGALDIEKLRAWRSALLAQELPDGRDFLTENSALRQEELEGDGLDWRETLGELKGGEEISGFSAYWNFTTEWTDEVILAKIPAKVPWEIFVWLPMGGWNECPAAQQMMAVSKYWNERYNAVPAALSHDVLEFTVPSPVEKEEDARKLALEQYGFCVDRVEQCGGDCTVGALADSLMKSKVWYFWWD